MREEVVLKLANLHVSLVKRGTTENAQGVSGVDLVVIKKDTK